jgi:CelD/BcsL family acetyltransferase involved in cellulose biosynthesis
LQTSYFSNSYISNNSTGIIFLLSYIVFKGRKVQAKLKCNHLTISSNDIDKIEIEWKRLEACAKNSIFTSWYWIASWLKLIEYKTQLIQVTFKDEIVGLAFLSEYEQTKYGFKAKQLWLNRTGDISLDKIWHEYNDILCQAGMEHSIRAAVLEYFENTLIQFDEFIVGASNNNIAQTPISNQLMQHTSWKTNSYSAKLTPEFSNWHSYLQTLSKNSRYQIKRTAKLFGGIENISITRAQSTDEALIFLQAVGEYHKIRWANQNSGFKNQFFINFHQQFIKEHFDSNIIDILKFHDGDKIFCYLYNFIYKGTVYFYLSGIEYTPDNRLKPGLLSHSMAIAYYAGLQYKKYDFMGGEGRYKDSLSNHKGKMIISNFRRKNLPFLLSHKLRKIKGTCARAINQLR